MKQEEVPQALQALEQIDEKVRQIARVPETDEMFESLVKEKRALIEEIKETTGDTPYWTAYGYHLR